MAMEVLKDRLQIREARRTLQSRGISFIRSGLLSLVRISGLIPGVAVGDVLKSWDVLSTISFIEGHLQKDDPILDIGCYASELVVALHRLGYSSLAGVDMNMDLWRMPYQDSIDYRISDFTHTDFKDASFRAITAISVIEHGFNGPSLLKEVSRLLKPSGYFIASFDYWPDKIDTRGVDIYGMDWRIFSRNEVIRFVADAEGYGLSPVGEMVYEVKDRPVTHAGIQYTFAWLALKKADYI